MDNRIKFALYLNDWSFESGDKRKLRRNADTVLVNEYAPHMKGHIFCPECTANLFRSPGKKDFAANGRNAYFAHSRGNDTDCGLRTKRAEGKRYQTEEEAKKALQNKELVIVEGFIKDNPTPPKKDAGEYDATQIEEQDGPVARVPISRHRGELFKLPSKFKTIRGICNKFDENINRYFFMPNGQYAIQLQDLLKNVESVTGEDEVPRIYFGKIVRSFNCGETSKNIRMTELKYGNENFADFYLKLTDDTQKEKGIDDNSKDRVVVMYGKVTVNGIGLCIEGLGWGEFALLPRKYENLLY